MWVLEDSPLEAEMARRALATAHTVEIFADAPLVLERIANRSCPDALVLDCQLPTLTGLEVCRFIRESFDEMELPIVMLTVEGHRGDLVDGLAAGANDYLTKPYHVSELLARVGTLVRTSHLHRARLRRARELALTAEIGAMLTRGRETAPQLCAAAVARHIDAAIAGIWISNGDGRLGQGAIAGTFVGANVATPHQVVSSRQRLVARDREADPFVADERWRSAAARTYVALPLIVDTRVVGALGVGVRRYLETEEIEALSSLADLVALGLERMSAERERAAILAREQHAREDAEEANRSKDEFLAILSHELRTPLNAIAGWLHMLRSGVVRPENVDRALATIERNTHAQKQLIDDLLDVSRIVSGKLSIELEDVHLGEVVESIVESMRPIASSKGIDLAAYIDDVGVTRGDSNRLKQVVSNLMTNAVKFTPSGGRVEVELRREGSSALIRVTDTGQGIAPDFLPHVFERFRQAETSKARQHGGLGLGLAIVRRLVELHGGSVRARSDGPGRGASFVVELPLVGALPVAPLRERVSFGGGSGELACAGVRAIVVDDDDDGRELVATFLSQAGARVRAARSVEEAMALVDADPPDVVVSDIGMPGADGFELARRLRSFCADAHRDIPAIALTAYTRAEDRASAEQAGFGAHLAKPLDPSLLVAAVRRLVRRAS